MEKLSFPRTTTVVASYMTNDPIFLLFQDCDWIFDEETCADDGVGNSKCQIASPGFPGVYPPQRRCRYLFNINTGSSIRLNFTHFNLPPE